MLKCVLRIYEFVQSISDSVLKELIYKFIWALAHTRTMKDRESYLLSQML